MKYTRASIRATVIAAMLAISAAPAIGQHQNESEPRPGESRLNRHQFLSSHNSYQGESLTELLDDLNVWEIELDVRWTEGLGLAGFYVLHHCLDPTGAGDLDLFLDEIANTQRVEEGFFVLNLELDDGYACLGLPFLPAPTFPTGYMLDLQQIMIDRFGRDAIYSWQDFEADDLKWPSPQELVRRGKHIAINANHYEAQSIFFRRWDSTLTRSQCAFWNTGAASQPMPDQQDRYVTRCWPNATCFLESDADWETAFENGFNFASTNCIESRIATHYLRMHPPVPAHVVPGEDSIDLGTSGRPHRGVAGFTYILLHSQIYSTSERSVNTTGGVVTLAHPSVVPVVLGSGTYDLESNDAFVIGAPVRLTADGNAVLISRSAVP